MNDDTVTGRRGPISRRRAMILLGSGVIGAGSGSVAGLSRPGSHLCGLSLEGQGVFPTES